MSMDRSAIELGKKKNSRKSLIVVFIIRLIYIGQFSILVNSIGAR